MPKISEAIILCGGFGTRLKSIISDRPKPMAEIAGKPFMAWLIDSLVQQGIRHIVLCTGYKSEVIENSIKLWQDKVQISISKEESPLGTGGAVKLALTRLKSSHFLVLNGDSYTPFQLKLLSKLHFSKQAIASLWLCCVQDASRYGTVKCDACGLVQNFMEKSNTHTPACVNAGIYILQKDIFNHYSQRSFSLETTVFPNLIGKSFYAISSERPFIDIGTPESYQMANEFIDTHHLRNRVIHD